MIPEQLKAYDYRENLITDANNPILIQKAWRDRFSGKSHWTAGYGGQAYLSRPSSEDALTWNVFRTLQLAGEPGLRLMSDILRVSEVRRILFWGCDVEHRGEEQQLLNILIRTIDGKHGGTMTEPDLVMITEKEVVFVECKLNLSGRTSPWRTKSSGSGKKYATYIDQLPELGRVGDWQEVYQLIRQYVFAVSLSRYLEKKPVVIPLINFEHEDTLGAFYSSLKTNYIDKGNVFRDFVTWQDIKKAVSGCNLANKDIMVDTIEAALQHAS